MQKRLFSELGLSEPILKAVEKLGFEETSPIQTAAIPALMSGKDIVGQSATGSGKTAAFAIPAIERVADSDRKVQILVLTPTRELATQVAEEFARLSLFRPKVHAVPIYGGASYDRQFSELRKGPQIVIGTPGRVIDHIQRNTLDLSEVKMTVLDECDRMLDMGFRDDIERILSATPRERQAVFFSATLPPPIRRLIDEFSKSPEHIKIESQAMTVPTVDQVYFDVPPRAKLDALTRLIDIHDARLSIVFANTQRMVDDLADALIARGYSADRLHGGMSQMLRTRTMAKFKKSEFDVLVATDVAGRGIDVDDLDLVINFDLPYDPEDYVHRIGRTGRAGRKGVALTLISGREVYRLQNVERFTRQRIRRGYVPTWDQVEEKRMSGVLDKVRAAIEAGKHTSQAIYIDRLMDEGLAATDLAAAMLHQLLASEGIETEKPGADPFARKDASGKPIPTPVKPAPAKPAPQAAKPVETPKAEKPKAEAPAPARAEKPQSAPKAEKPAPAATPAPVKPAPAPEKPAKPALDAPVDEEDEAPAEEEILTPAAAALAPEATTAAAPQQAHADEADDEEEEDEDDDSEDEDEDSDEEEDEDDASEEDEDEDESDEDESDDEESEDDDDEESEDDDDEESEDDDDEEDEEEDSDDEDEEESPKPAKKAPVRAPAGTRELPAPASGYKWITLNLGKSDGLTPRDVVDAITEGGDFPAKTVGLIKLLDTETNVQVLAGNATDIVEALDGGNFEGKTVRVHFPRTLKSPFAGKPEKKGKFGDRKPYGEKRSYGDRKPYGEKRAYGDGPKRPYGEKPAYGDGPKRPYGDKPAYGDGPKRPYGDKPAYGDGPKRPYGEKRPYGDRPKRPYGDKPAYGDGPKRPYGEKRSFGDGPKRSFGDGPKRSYGDKPSYGDGPKRPYGGPRKGGPPKKGPGRW